MSVGWYILFVCVLSFTSGWVLATERWREKLKTAEMQAKNVGFSRGAAWRTRMGMRKPRRRPYGCRFCNRNFSSWPGFQNHECNP